MPDRLYNVNVASSELLPTPEEIKTGMPMPAAAEEFVFRTRGSLRRILEREDPRLFVVVGPCSIHDLDAAREAVPEKPIPDAHGVVLPGERTARIRSAHGRATGDP